MTKISLFLFLLATTSQLSAQDEEAKDARGGIQLRGFAFAHFKEIDRLELRYEDKSVGELLLPTGQLRTRTSVKKRTFTYGVTEGEKFRSLGNIALPEEGRDFILVFAPEQNGYRSFIVRADDPKFRGDDAYFFNFTKYRLGVLLGTAKEQVPAWGNALLRPAFPADSTFYQVMFAYEKEKEFIPFNNTRWPVNPNTKALVFVYHDPKLDCLIYRAVTELAGS